MTNIKLAIFAIILTLTSSCAYLSSKEENNSDSDKPFPQSREDQRRDRLGKIGGGDGLFKFGGSKDDDASNPSSSIKVNSYLWRASIDTISFMPLVSADPFGGVIISDWYENPESRGERFKITVLILSNILRSDAVKVNVFKQTLDSKLGWKDAVVSSQVVTDLENKILTRARQLRIEKE